MTKTTIENLSGVAETLLITLYLRAMESRRPDGLIRDKKAVELVEQMDDHTIDRIKRFPMSNMNIAATIRRGREFDRLVQAFLRRQPEAVVVHIGCGLDTRFERVNNVRVTWYDLDLPDVITLRRKLLGDEGGRYHLLGSSVLGNDWLDAVGLNHQQPFMFLAEGVFMYLEEAQLKTLVLTLRDRFPGAELVFDAFNPFHVRTNTQLYKRKKLGVPLHWGIWHGQELEGWGEGIRLLEDWGWLDEPEPRLAGLRWLRSIPLIGRMMRIYHFQLGKAAEGKY